jgi:hypothetical protein
MAPLRVFSQPSDKAGQNEERPGLSTPRFEYAKTSDGGGCSEKLGSNRKGSEMSEAASATISEVLAANGAFQYSATLDDTGSTTIGTFWFAWVPGGDFLDSSPTNIVTPSGWTALITNAGATDGYAIQFVATSSASDLQPGASLSGFGFTSTETPAQLSGNSSFFPATPETTSFVYSAGPFSDPGFEFEATVAASKRAQSDFNGDGTSDILWRSTSGDIGYWALNNNVETWHDFGASSTSYSVVGSGDFNGDGTSDILWRDAATGDTGSWTIVNNTATWHDYGVASMAYSVVGVGDINGDGDSDVVWRNNATGDTGYWAITNNGASETWHDFGATDTSYAVVGVGDFNGDGTADLLWRNASTGDTGFWAITNSGGTETWHDLGASSTAYSVVGVGDLTGDGKADVLWRNNSTGDLGFWAISNNAATWHDYGATDLSYQVAGVHDYNGDGAADILWRRASDGDTGDWSVTNSGVTTSWHDFGVTSTAYSVQST